MNNPKRLHNLADILREHAREVITSKKLDRLICKLRDLVTDLQEPHNAEVYGQSDDVEDAVVHLASTLQLLVTARTVAIDTDRAVQRFQNDPTFMLKTCDDRAPMSKMRKMMHGMMHGKGMTKNFKKAYGGR